MKSIKLMTMDIRNFKGIHEQHIDFGGNNTDIFGRNATGKTSIKDAFNWLLFNKNSDGKTEFGIKPTDKNGDIIHNLETSVEAVFDVDGEVKEFKKTLSEVWTRKRGDAQATFTKNENSYFVNTVPKKKTEYTAEISNLISEDLFRMITDPLHFNQIDWKKRRSILIDICGNISDEDVIASSRELAPLTDELKGRSVEEYKSVLRRNMKATNKELDAIPSKIDEAEKAKPFIDDDVEEEKREQIATEIQNLLHQRNDITNGSEILRMQEEVKNLTRQMSMVGSGFSVYSTKEYAKLKVIEDKKAETEKSIATTKIQLERIVEQIEGVEEKKKSLSAEWDTVFGETFVGNICPTCGRELPEDQLEVKKFEFNIAKAERLDAIEAKLKTVKEKEMSYRMSKASLQDVLKESQTFLAGLTESHKQASADIEKLKSEHEKEVRAEKEKLQASIDKLNKDIEGYKDKMKDDIEAIDARLRMLEADKAKIDTVIASYALVKKQEERIEFLQGEQKRLAREYTNFERYLFLTEQFTVTKVHMLTDKINSHFRHAQFKLFNQNINGGIEETCVTTYNGIPFGDLNNAMKINIGLDIINTLCQYNGTVAPIFIDNAESVLDLEKTASQVICLVVADTALEIKKG